MVIDGIHSAPITTQSEFKMLMIMDRITDRIGWEKKVFNEEITNKWRAELVNYDEDSDDGDNDNAENEKVQENVLKKWRLTTQMGGRVEISRMKWWTG